MIRLIDLHKGLGRGGARKVIARGIDALFPSGRSVALLGRNGAGKSSLLKIIAGTMASDRGHVLRRGSVSWPVGFAGSFHPDLTGAQNVRFVARVYGVDTDELIAFVGAFSELGAHLHRPFRGYSAGMRARLAFGTSMGIRFDTYLVDEVTSVGDAAFRQKSREVFAERMARSGAIVVSHNMEALRGMCDAGAVLENGRLEYFDDLEAAITRYGALMRNGQP